MRQRGHIQSTQSTERGAFATATGSSNAFVVDLRPVPPTLSEGLRLTFEANHNITGATTVNVNSLGVKSIKKNVSVDLQQGDIKTGQIVDIVYDGTNFQILTGTSGFSGYSGAVGDTGTSGYSGFAGNTGLSGFSGETGASGFSGFSGFDGISVSGYSGYSGRSGFSGDNGAQGYSGISGKSGYSGRSGYSGTNGATGASGTSGYSGRSGYSGLRGPIGLTGAQGTSGFSGRSGYSGAVGAKKGYDTSGWNDNIGTDSHIFGIRERWSQLYYQRFCDHDI